MAEQVVVVERGARQQVVVSERGTRGPVGPQGPVGPTGPPSAIVLNADEPVPAGTPVGTIILRRP